MGGFFDGLIAWSIRNRHVVLLAAVALVVVGIWSASRASLDVLPDFTPPRVVVQTEAPGMTSVDVEELVTRPLEQALLGTAHTTSVRSTSSPGLSVVTLMFEDDVDIYRARQLVGERIQLVTGTLPSAVHDPQLAPISAPIGALLKFCITSSAADPRQAARDLRAFAHWTLRPQLIAIPGIAQVTAHGGDVERVEVRPDPLRLRDRGVTVAELLVAVSGSQVITGAGFVDAGRARLDIQADARLTIDNAVEVLSGTVVTMRGGQPVRVADVAEVVHAEEPAVGAAIYDGRPAVYVQVTKLPWADTLDTTRAVERALHQLEARLPPGATIEPPVFRQADFVLTSLFSVGRAMAIGSALVVLILIAFLRRGRLATISLVAIPLSILAAVTILVARGASINAMTLGGLAIAVGEVVDDAIVDVENVWRRLRENARLAEPRPALDVIHAASKEIRSSVVYATIIVCLVLVPVLFLGGMSGRIFSPLAQAYILAIASSLVIALTVTPAMCALLLPRIATAEAEPTRFARWLVGRYRRALARIVEHPRLVLAIVGVATIGAGVVLPMLGGRFLPEFKEKTVIAHIHAVPGTSLEEATRLAVLVDAEVRPEAGGHVAARIGRAELDEDAAPVNRIEMDVVLRPGDDREWEEIGFDIAQRMGRVPGLGFVVEGFLGERIHEILSGETSPVVVKVVGPDLGTLRGLAAKVASLMQTVDGMGAGHVEPQIDVSQIQIRPDPGTLALHGLRPLDVLDQVIAWRQGRPATEILGRDGRVMEVAVAGPPILRTREALADLPVRTATGATVPLSALASIDDVPAPALINHDGGERRITIGADAAGAGLSGAVADLQDKLASLELPQGYRVELGGEAVERKQAATRLLLIGGLVLLGIFAVLATAFASVRDAGVVLLNLPLGLIGGVVGAALTPEGLSVAGFVGFVTLFGIISRNGIMLVAHKQHLDAARPEMDPVARVLLAAEERVLPIVMTAATAGLALLPLAVSFEAAGSELEAPMALIVCCGLVTSTALNMIVLPTLYVWFARRQQRRAAKETA